MDIDLGRVCEALNRHGKKYKSIITKTRAYYAVQSSIDDMVICERLIEDLASNEIIMETQEKKSLTLEKTAKHQAYFAWAVIVYARISDTNSKIRPSVDILKELNDAEKKIHFRLKRLRNDALAHLGNAGEDWCRHTTRIVFNEDESFGVHYASARYNFNAKLILEMLPFIGRVKSILQDKLKTAQDNVGDEVTSLINERDETFGRLLIAHKFDEHKFFSAPPPTGPGVDYFMYPVEE